VGDLMAAAKTKKKSQKAPKPQPGDRGFNAETGEIENLELVEAESEIRALEVSLQAANDKLKGAERDINTWRVRYEELRRDKEAEAREHELWDPACDLFSLWKRGTERIEKKKRRIKFSADRFFMVLPFLKKYGEEDCQQAIIGRLYQHFTNERTNGSTKHYFEWERIFGALGQGTASENFEESRDRAPDGWARAAKALMSDG
jgi:hypothetical protein